MFNEGDWTCSGCGNTNWARRSTCNMCNQPKPGTVDTNREGNAGGFKVLCSSSILRGDETFVGREPTQPCPSSLTLQFAQLIHGAIHADLALWSCVQELDEAEIEEARRRRQQLENDDSEMCEETPVGAEILHIPHCNPKEALA